MAGQLREQAKHNLAQMRDDNARQMAKMREDNQKLIEQSQKDHQRMREQQQQQHQKLVSDIHKQREELHRQTARPQQQRPQPQSQHQPAPGLMNAMFGAIPNLDFSAFGAANSGFASPELDDEFFRGGTASELESDFAQTQFSPEFGGGLDARKMFEAPDVHGATRPEDEASWMANFTLKPTTEPEPHQVYTSDWNLPAVSVRVQHGSDSAMAPPAPAPPAPAAAAAAPAVSVNPPTAGTALSFVTTPSVPPGVAVTDVDKAPPRPSPATVAEWKVGDVAAFLISINLSAFVDKFVENEITGPDLLELTDAELRDDLGISQLGARKKILRGIRGLMPEGTLDPTSPDHCEADKHTIPTPQRLIVYRELSLGREVGRGAFGVVYSGQWRGADVAVKLLRSASPEAMEDLQREADIMLKMPPHPHVVTFLGVSETDDGCVCIVTEYVSGGSLLKQLRRPDSVGDYVSRLNLAKGIAAGLLHLHSEGIVHRDLAARNVLVVNRAGVWFPVVTDFGLSRALSKPGVQKTQNRLGAIKWMSPEALSGEYSQASDVWAMGVVLCEIWSDGDEPFPNTQPMQIAQMLLRRETPAVPPDAPPAVAHLITSCFAFDASARPTFSRLHAELSQLVVTTVTRIPSINVAEYSPILQ